MPRITGSQEKPGGRHGMDSPSEPPDGANTDNTFISGWGRIILFVWSHHICGTLLWQPSETNTGFQTRLEAWCGRGSAIIKCFPVQERFQLRFGGQAGVAQLTHGEKNYRKRKYMSGSILLPEKSFLIHNSVGERQVTWCLPGMTLGDKYCLYYAVCLLHRYWSSHWLFSHLHFFSTGWGDYSHLNYCDSCLTGLLSLLPGPPHTVFSSTHQPERSCENWSTIRSPFSTRHINGFNFCQSKKIQIP